ncbi:MAG TPA: DNA repair protein RecO [Roseiarcus sp.]|jgi:DNA repair protein RecO (recombination protein O)
MEWRDEGIVIGVRRHGENSTIVEAMTRGHGRHLGLVRGGRTTRLQSALQPGNSLGLVWRARLDEHLGAYAVEPLVMRAGRFIASGLALAGVVYLGALLRLLPERDPHESLFEALELIAERLDEAEVAPALVARFEAQVLTECGFALDLERCAVTGTREDLIYVSPKSGRAVSASAGAPWRDRLLPLPAFLRPGAAAAPGAHEIADAFRLTGHFLMRDLFAPRSLPLPDARRAFLAAAAKAESE